MTLARTDSLMAVHAAERARRRATTAVVVAAALALAPLPFVVSTSSQMSGSAPSPALRDRAGRRLFHQENSIDSTGKNWMLANQSAGMVSG